MADTIPNQDPQALQWLQAFANGIAANYSLYMLTAPDSVAISAAVNGFASALAVASVASTRTAVTVSEKSAARTAAEQICRQFAILVKFNNGVSDADKLAIGVKPVNHGRNPVNAPATSPLLNVIAATPGAQTLRYADSMTPDSARKPFGATELQLFVAVGAGPVVTPDGAAFYGKFTKNPMTVAFPPADNGKQATYFARWSSRKGENGPWSTPVSMTIAA